MVNIFSHFHDRLTLGTFICQDAIFSPILDKHVSRLPRCFLVESLVCHKDWLQERHAEGPIRCSELEFEAL